MSNTTMRPQSDSLAANTDALQAWIVDRLALMLGVKSQDIGVNEPLSDYGLESVEAIALSGELSDLLNRKLAPTLAWDYPTIAALAAFLSTDAANIEKKNI